jgi:hypothetical protein
MKPSTKILHQVLATVLTIAALLASSPGDYDGTLNARWTPDIFDDE